MKNLKDLIKRFEAEHNETKWYCSSADDQSKGFGIFALTLKKTDQFWPHTAILFVCLFVYLFIFVLLCWWLRNHKSFKSVFLKCQLMILITSLYNNVHVYTHTHKYILTYTHPYTYTDKFCLQYTLSSIWWCLIITSLRNNIFTFY